MVNSSLIRPYLWGGVAWGGTLDSHEHNKKSLKPPIPSNEKET